MESVPITTKVVSSNPAHGEVFSIQHYMSVTAAGRRFSPATSVSSPNKTERHNIAEILLKVALSTTPLTQSNNIGLYYTKPVV